MKKPFKLILTVLAIIAGILPTFSQNTEGYALFQCAMEECRNAWGQQQTRHKDAYGRSVGTSTMGTNIWGQQETQQNATNSNTTIRTC